MGQHLFLSYARADADFARDLYHQLEGRGIPVWARERVEWDGELQQAIDHCALLIFIMTPNSVVAENCHDEWNYALSRRKTVVPLLVESCGAMPLRLRRFQYIDLINTDTEKAFDTLLHIIHTNEDSEPPSFDKTEVENPLPEDVQRLIRLAENLNRKGAFYPTWVVVPGGHILVGDDSLSETPEHGVHPGSFLIAKTPITQQQYQRFIRLSPDQSAPCDTDHFLEYSWDGRLPPAGKEQHPVVLVDAYDAQKYCEWLTREFDYELNGLKIRLPSEIEWELAARGTDYRPYPWGYHPPAQEFCNFNGHYAGTTVAGQFPRGMSPYGVFDMVGNVWEWTRSTFKPYPYRPNDGREASDGMRVLRGGSWEPGANPVMWRCAYRYPENPDHKSDTIGFRVAIQ